MKRVGLSRISYIFPLSSLPFKMLSIHGFVRQNAWGKTPHSLQTVRETGVLHCPWGHTRQDMDDFIACPEEFYKHKPNTIAKTFLQFDVGTMLLVAEKGSSEVLIVELTSSPQTGHIPHCAIVRSERTCNHTLTHPGHGCHNGCAECEDSVQKVVRTNIPLMDYLQEGCVIEPMYGIWRSVRVLESINRDKPGYELVKKYTSLQPSAMRFAPISIPFTQE